MNVEMGAGWELHDFCTGKWCLANVFEGFDNCVNMSNPADIEYLFSERAFGKFQSKLLQDTVLPILQSFPCL